jgi:hypothetical protein
MRCGVTGKAPILFGDTTGAKILAGDTGRLKVLAGATITAQVLGLQLWEEKSWHKASPEEIEIRPINKMRSRRMQLTRGQETSSRLLPITRGY